MITSPLAGEKSLTFHTTIEFSVTNGCFPMLAVCISVYCLLRTLPESASFFVPKQFSSFNARRTLKYLIMVWH